MQVVVVLDLFSNKIDRFGECVRRCRPWLNQLEIKE
jgi:hypothetical protein